MSDTSYSSISQTTKLIDIIDDEWILDQLSDDEIEIPKEFDVKPDDEEEEDPTIDPDDVWDDLGLDIFEQDQQKNGTPSHTQLQTNSSSTSNTQSASSS